MGLRQLVDRFIGGVPGPAQGVPSAPGRGRAKSEYMRGERSPIFAGWNPALRDQREDVRAGYWRAAARTVDAIHNSGWLSGAVDQAIASTIGTGLQLASRPDFEALGWTADKASEWARLVERRWEAWASCPAECDAGGRMTMGQIQAAVLRSYYGYGEAIAALPWIRRPISRSRTKVQLISPHRLVQDSNGIDLYQGIRIDRYSLPLAYCLRMADPVSEGGQIIEMPARDAASRPMIAHVFDGGAGQIRGISPMAPVLQVVRQLDQLQNATLAAAMLQTILAATVESAAPTPEVLRAFQGEDEQDEGASIEGMLGAKTAWYENTKIDLGGFARIAHLLPGEKLNMQSSKHPNGNYEAFAKFLLRETARCLGMTFEAVSGDYSSATYASVRMSVSENWPLTLHRRKVIPGRFSQTVFEAWIEEEIDAGLIPFPGGLDGFLANRPAAIRADWRGPAKPQADDLKAAKAYETLKSLGVITDEAICADMGTDWEDVYEQLQREQSLREKLGLRDPLKPGVDPVADKLLTQDDPPPAAKQEE